MTDIREKIAMALYHNAFGGRKSWDNIAYNLREIYMGDADVALVVVGWKPIDEKAKDGRIVHLHYCGGVMYNAVWGNIGLTDFYQWQIQKEGRVVSWLSDDEAFNYMEPIPLPQVKPKGNDGPWVEPLIALANEGKGE